MIKIDWHLLFIVLLTGLPTYALADDTCYPDQTPYDLEVCVDDSFQWDAVNSISVIQRTDSGDIFVIGGLGNLTYEVSGNGFYLDAAHTVKIVTNVVGRNHTIYTNNACGTGVVTMTDYCKNQAIGQIKTDIVAFEWDESQSVSVLAPNSSAALTVQGGVPPYTWEVIGDCASIDGSGSQVLFSTASCFCYATTVKVTDSCNTVVSREITSSTGYWMPVDYRTLPLAYPLKETSSSGHYYTYQNDRYKVMQEWQFTASGEPTDEQWEGDPDGWSTEVIVYPDFEKWTICIGSYEMIDDWRPWAHWLGQFVPTKNIFCRYQYTRRGKIRKAVWGGFPSSGATPQGWEWQCTQ